MEDLKELLAKLDNLEIKNLSLINEALTHRSFSRDHNERLEFLGDAVLELVITELLYKDFPTRNEGELTSFRAALVKSESLAEEASRLEINKYLRLSRGEEATGGRNRLYILADVMEALIGAIYLDQGYEASKKFIEKNIYHKIHEVVEKRLDIDAKSKLQELIQEKLRETPVYKLLKEEGPDHDKTFTVQVIIGEKEYGIGVGRSKQIAEQDAAMKTLERF